MESDQSELSTDLSTNLKVQTSVDQSKILSIGWTGKKVGLACIYYYSFACASVILSPPPLLMFRIEKARSS